MKVREIAAVLGELAPLELAADWDNVGLLLGDESARARTLMLCIDLTAEVLVEASRKKVDMVMAYHPVIFKPVGRITAEASPVLWQAARKGVAVYSMHTALDAAAGGTNDTLAEMLELRDVRPLEPAEAAAECKVVTFLPAGDVSAVSEAAFAAGAGQIGQYSQCAFRSEGVGQLRGGQESSPTVGRAGRLEQVEEIRLEMIAPAGAVEAVRAAIASAHSYEEPPVDVYPLLGQAGELGMGRVGRLARPIKLPTLIGRVKQGLGVAGLMQAGPTDGKVATVAVSAGSAGGMWKAALAAGADAYLTGEMRHHDALAAAAAGLAVLCVGHSNSERITLGKLARRLAGMLDGVKVMTSATDRDPFTIR